MNDRQLAPVFQDFREIDGGNIRRFVSRHNRGFPLLLKRMIII
jgi:hypothetical protein